MSINLSRELRDKDVKVSINLSSELKDKDGGLLNALRVALLTYVTYLTIHLQGIEHKRGGPPSLVTSIELPLFL